MHFLPLSFARKRAAMENGDRNDMRPRQDKSGQQVGMGGFSLIELLIVVAIILIIAAIAIPNFIRARMQANEAGAIQNLRTVSTAQVAYQIAYQNGYAPNLATLSGVAPPNCNQAVLIDVALATGQKSGYRYIIYPGPANAIAAPNCGAAGVSGYMIAAEPLVVGTTGQRSLCMAEDGVIHQDATGAPVPPGGCGLLSPIQ